jgi:hypothetical protein
MSGLQKKKKKKDYRPHGHSRPIGQTLSPVGQHWQRQFRMNPIENVRTAFQELGERVDRAMRVQRGDHARLYAQRDEVRLLLQDFERVR